MKPHRLPPDTGPPKQERRLYETALRNAQLAAAYRLLAFSQAPFGFVFWKVEQRKARSEIARERRRK